ncbi:G-protein coupled receptor 37-like 1 [Denticeps clupeoides]|uniref:G-protein coupled receptors family 1 profile domain-containing protein n=1 Tax=Denticeps clupeoides TaxID=299321 RepID=A0AAY4C816_9TELE|nr:G-protein coupled receptor 37-like 1 [Denticeps clupeoides]
MFSCAVLLLVLGLAEAQLLRPMDPPPGTPRHGPDQPPPARSEDGKPRPQFPHNHRHPRPYEPGSFFTTPGGAPAAPDAPHGQYALLLLALLLFAVGIVGNLAVMCVVCHNFYMQSAWNCVLASLALWDFVLLFFCLPVVVFSEISHRRVLGGLSCRIVPYIEVTSLGVTTFSLCALSIDRFHSATSVRPRTRPAESCQSILAKLAVIWVGSMVLAAPEVLLWQLNREVAPGTGTLVDACVQRPSAELPESLFSLVLTYHNARMWWSFGCFFCLPLLFTLSCQLLTRHVAQETRRAGRPSSSSTTYSSSSSCSSSSPKKKQQQQQQRHREQQMNRTILALALTYAACVLPENGCSMALSYAGVEVGAATQALLALSGHFLLFARAAATPVLLLCLSRPLGRAFADCCCCCCDECRPRTASSSCTSTSSSRSTAATDASSGKPQAVHIDSPKDDPSALAIGTPC